MVNEIIDGNQIKYTLNKNKLTEYSTDMEKVKIHNSPIYRNDIGETVNGSTFKLNDELYNVYYT